MSCETRPSVVSRTVRGCSVYFLEHEIREAAFFRHDRVPGDALGFALDGVAVEIGDAHAVGGDHSQVAIA